MKRRLFKRAKEEAPEHSALCTVWLYDSLNPTTGYYENGKWKILYGNKFTEIHESHEVIFWAYNPQIDIRQVSELKYFDLQNIK